MNSMAGERRIGTVIPPIHTRFGNCTHSAGRRLGFTFVGMAGVAVAAVLICTADALSDNRANQVRSVDHAAVIPQMAALRQTTGPASRPPEVPDAPTEPESFDYRELREQVDAARRSDAGPSGQILGLPTEDFFDPAQPTGLGEVFRGGLILKAICKYANSLRPNQGGVIWLSVVILFVVAFDRKRFWSWRNLDVAMLPVLCLFLIDLISVGGQVEDPQRRSLARLMFTGVFVVSAYWLVRCLVGAMGHLQSEWKPNLPRGGLAALSLLAVGLNVILCLTNAPNDCGHFTNIGAKRLLQTGMFPYGDPMLRGGAGATYGPVAYLAHIPFQLLLPESASADAGSRAVDKQAAGATTRAVAADDRPFEPPPELATKLCTLTFHLAGLVALWLVGRQLGGATLGWALVCLYASSAYVQGLGGEEEMICGMTYVSHVAPAATLLMAFALLGRPLLSGAMLAVSCGVLFFPAFFAPAWLGYYFWKRNGARRFLLGFAGMGLVIASVVLLRTESGEGESAMSVVFNSTVAHQESPDAYGASPFSFWGANASAKEFWQRPLIEDQFMLKPAFLVFAGLVAASFFLARNRSRTQFAFLIAALAIGVQLWKSHATGTYVEWYLPFLLIGLFAQRAGMKGVRETSAPQDQVIQSQTACR